MLWDRVVKEVSTGGEIFLLSEYDRFEWDVICVLPPYSNSRLQKFFPKSVAVNHDSVPPLDGDGAWAFAFVLNDSVIHVERKGYKYYFDTKHKEPGSNCLDRNSAAFHYIEDFIGNFDYILLERL